LWGYFDEGDLPKEANLWSKQKSLAVLDEKKIREKINSNLSKISF
jgi:hypothetical protein